MTLKRTSSIGINYIGRQDDLRGCINDSNNICELLIHRFGYSRDNIIQLVDDSTDPRKMPTKENILRAMHWLVKDAKPNDSLFFHFSGHAGQTKDQDGDEADGYDEVIYPLDFERSGHIVDDDMHAIMVKPLPPGCRLTAIFDSSHSGSLLDLPYTYSTRGIIKQPDSGQGVNRAIRNLGSMFKTVTGQTTPHAYAIQTRASPADVISLSSCKDSQASGDVVVAGRATGLMSYALIQVLNQRSYPTYQELLNGIRDVLKNKYSNQKPQLSSSHPMDTNILFIA
ncbi:unnamed protein product [Rhizoctonia solani]|uniref:Peptidase C14 caspase domain-containing protein n=1 Tax=Rhizoctonia solani TaxID=456999 RepID=A0A8H3GBW8_9AGAM|nr:unnamed protein product [Rhizoctonia solani]